MTRRASRRLLLPSSAWPADRRKGRARAAPHPRRPDHRRLGFRRRRGHPGGPQDLLGARRLRRQRHHRDHGAEHAGRHRSSRSPPPSSPRRSRRCSTISPSAPSSSACWRASDRSGGGGGLARLAVPVVLDPVMIAKSGDALLRRRGRDDAAATLLPLATLLITPNLPEAARLLDTARPLSEDEMAAQGEALARARRQGGADEGRSCGRRLSAPTFW